MVWGLFPVDSLPGDQKYFISSKGTYKVGRKGCDVIINTDKGVSRIHAEIIVDSMTSMDPVESRSSDVRIKDCSKYGTFINKKLGSQTKVHDYPNKVTTLKDGDLISFGTGNATYRFCFVPLIFFVYSTKPFQVDRSLQEQISSIGACDSQNWRAECTHALVDESSPVKEDLIDVVVDKKPVILKKWVKVLAEKSISTELPGFVDCVPVMTFEGSPIKVVDPKARENSLAEYTFLLGATHLYKFGDRLQSLLDVGGAKVLSINDFYSNSQASEDVTNSGVVLVNPAGSTNQFSAYQHLRSVPRVTEVNLISAVLSGHLDSSFVESPPNSSSQEEEEEKRNWLELPPDVTSLIFLKLGTVDILGSAQWVCYSWWKLSKQPHLFRSIHVENVSTIFGYPGNFIFPFNFMVKLSEGLAREAIDRSCGELVKFSVRDMPIDELLLYMCEKSSSSLRSLRLVEVELGKIYEYADYNNYVYVTNNVIIEIAKKLPHLEELEIIKCSEVSKDVIETFGRFCPQLKSFRLNRGSYWNDTQFNEAILAIAENMPELRHLNLAGNLMTHDDLRAILDGCPHLKLIIRL